jgi:hypothetical protein
MPSLEAFQVDLSALSELDPRVLDKLAYDVRDEDFSTERFTGDSRSVVDGGAEETVRLLDRIARSSCDAADRVRRRGGATDR